MPKKLIGRRPPVDVASYFRREAIFKDFPNLKQIATLPHCFVEFVIINQASFRRFYVSLDETTGVYYCYIPTRKEREYGTLPQEGEQVSLYEMADLELHTINRENVIFAGVPTIVNVWNTQVSPTFNVESLAFSL